MWIIFKIVQLVALYTLIGLLWTAFLEHTLVGKIEGRAGQPFSTGDRVRQIVFWPISVIIFTYNVIKYIIEEMFL